MRESVASSHDPLGDPMLPSLYKVVQFKKETSDVFTLHIRPQNKAEAISRYEPGQFNMLYVFGVGEVPISICGDPDDDSVLVHSIRAVGWVTNHLEKIKTGNTIGIRGPFGRPWPIEKGQSPAQLPTQRKDILLVAGGIGLAPLKALLHHVANHRKQYGRVTLLYGARTPKDLLFINDLEQWKSKYDIHVETTVDHAETRSSARARLVWQGDVGVVPSLVSRAKFDPTNTIAMLCGPEIMMRFTILELLKRGVPDSAIYLSMERNMKCAIGFCGHCQYIGHFLCKDGPVYSYETIKHFFVTKEL